MRFELKYKVMRLCKVITILFLTFLTSRIDAQNAQETAFKSLKAEIQKKKTGNFSFNSYSELIAAINEVKGDTTASKTFEYLTPFFEAGVKSDNIANRQFSSNVLVNCIGKNAVLTRSVIGRLQKFKQRDFSDEAKINLKRGLHESTNNVGDIAKLTAFVCGTNCVEDLQNVSMNQAINKREKKDIKLALIRAGQATNEQKLLQSAKAQVVNDDFVYNLVNDLTYTRSKIVFDYLLEIINRDSKDCTSANNDNPEPMICAYRVIEQVAPCILNFPARVNSYGELETKDYKKLLNDVRDWIGKNKDTYELNLTNY